MSSGAGYDVVVDVDEEVSVISQSPRASSPSKSQILTTP